eukprot:EG_transcript_23125
MSSAAVHWGPPAAGPAPLRSGWVHPALVSAAVLGLLVSLLAGGAIPLRLLAPRPVPRASAAVGWPGAAAAPWGASAAAPWIGGSSWSPRSAGAALEASPYTTQPVEPVKAPAAPGRPAAVAAALSAALGAILGLALRRRRPSHGPVEEVALAAITSYRPRTPTILAVPPPRRFDTRLTALLPVTDATFTTEVLQSPVPVLVSFSAPWCGPCKLMEPVLADLALEYRGRLKVVKINTDEAPGRTVEYGVRSIPTILLLKEGAKKETIIGAVTKKFIV